MLAGSRNEFDFMHHRGNGYALQTLALRDPLVAAVETLEDRVTLGAGVHVSGKKGIDGQAKSRANGSCLLTRWVQVFAGIARLVDVIVRGHVEQVGLGRVQRNLDNRFAASTASREGYTKNEN